MNIGFILGFMIGFFLINTLYGKFYRKMSWKESIGYGSVFAFVSGVILLIVSLFIK